jgi:AraC-like DNA-binding protein
MAIIWGTSFLPNPLIAGLPRLRNVAEQYIDDASYYYEGKNRPDKDHYLYEYTLEGEGIFWDAEKEYRIRPGSGFLCRINDPKIGYKYPPDAAETWHIIFVTFSGAGDLVRKLVKKFGPVFHLPTDSMTVRNLLEYRKQSGSPVEVTPGEGMSLIHSLLSALADGETERTRDTAAVWLVQEARRVVRAHVEKNLNVTELADLLNVSPEHLCRVFRKETAMTPLAFITRERIRRACDLLLDYTLSCKEICAKLEYDNASHFARTFRRVTGITPSEFRRRGGVTSI